MDFSFLSLTLAFLIQFLTVLFKLTKINARLVHKTISYLMEILNASDLLVTLLIVINVPTMDLMLMHVQFANQDLHFKDQSV